MKMRSLIPILASLLLSSPGFAKEKILLILGDSLTEGYGVAREAAFPALLEKKLQSLPQKWKVINSGVSGSTTASAKSRLLWALKANPDVILIALGANDGLRGLKTSASEENLRQAIREAKKQKIKVVLGGIYMPPNYGKSYTTEFRNMYLRLAKSEQVPLIPFILDKVAGNPEYNLADGIHPNEKGHAIIAETIFEGIKGHL